jgi:hypothetical protein
MPTMYGKGKESDHNDGRHKPTGDLIAESLAG